jgi:hypothetical protein
MRSTQILVALTFVATAAPSIAAPLPWALTSLSCGDHTLTSDHLSCSLNIFDLAKAEKSLACSRYGLCDHDAQPAAGSKRDVDFDLQRRGLSLGPFFKFGISLLPQIAGLFAAGSDSNSKRALDGGVDATSIDWVKMANEMEKKYVYLMFLVLVLVGSASGWWPWLVLSGVTQADLDRSEAEFAKMLGSANPSASTLSARKLGLSSGLRASTPSGLVDFLKGLLEKTAGPLQKREDSKIDWDQMAEELEKRYVLVY